MERLIEKISEYIQCNNNECRLGYCDRECEHYKRMVNKLAEYEIAEEQELLLKLPCNVGDTLYFVENGEVFEFVVYSFDIRPLQRFVRDYYGMSLNFSKFNKTVFLTKEEAEQALEQMKAGAV